MSALFLKRRIMMENTTATTSTMDSMTKRLATIDKSGRIESLFPVLLFKMLQAESTADDPVVCWNSKGTGFVVRNSLQVFETDVLPRYFGGLPNIHTHSDFQYQLRMYGFTSKNDTYQHPKLRRERPELVRKMKGRSQNKVKPKSKDVVALRKLHQERQGQGDGGGFALLPSTRYSEEEASRRVSLDTSASEPPSSFDPQQQDTVDAVVASYIATKNEAERKHKLRLQQPTTKKQQQQKQKPDSLEAMCSVLLLPQQRRCIPKRHDNADAAVQASFDEAFQVFLQEDDDGW